MPNELDELEALIQGGAPPTPVAGPPGPPGGAPKVSSELDYLQMLVEGGKQAWGAVETVTGLGKAGVDWLAQQAGYPTAGAAVLAHPTLTKLAAPAIGFTLGAGSNLAEQLKAAEHEKLAALTSGAVERGAEAATDPLMWVGGLIGKFPVVGRALQVLLAKGLYEEAAAAITEAQANGLSEKFWGIVGGAGVDVGLIGGAHVLTKAAMAEPALAEPPAVRPGAPPRPPVERVRPPGPPEAVAPQGEAVAAPSQAPVAPVVPLAPGIPQPAPPTPPAPAPAPTAFLRTFVTQARDSLLSEAVAPHTPETLQRVRAALGELDTRGVEVPAREITANAARTVLRNLGWPDSRTQAAPPREIAAALEEFRLRVRGMEAPPAPGTGAPAGERHTLGSLTALIEGGIAPEELSRRASVVDLARAFYEAQGAYAPAVFDLGVAFRTALDRLPAESPPRRNAIVKRALAWTQALGGGGEWRDFAEMSLRHVNNVREDLVRNGEQPIAAHGVEVWNNAPDATGLRSTHVTVTDESGKVVASLSARPDGHVLSFAVSPRDTSLGGKMNVVRLILAAADHTNIAIPDLSERSGHTQQLVNDFARILRISDPEALAGRKLSDVVKDPEVARRLETFERRFAREAARKAGATAPAGGEPVAGEPAVAPGAGEARPDLAGEPREEDLRPPAPAAGGERAGVAEPRARGVGRPEDQGGGVPVLPGEGPPGPPELVRAPAAAPAGYARGVAPENRAIPPGPPGGGPGVTPPEPPRAQLGGSSDALPSTAGNLALQLEVAPPPPPTPGGPPPAPAGEGPFVLTEPMLQRVYHTETARIAGEVLSRLGIPWDRRAYPVFSDQVQDMVHDGRIPLTRLIPIVEHAGMNVGEFISGLWRPNVTNAAQVLADLSAVTRRLEQTLAQRGIPPRTRDSLRGAIEQIGSEVDVAAMAQSWWKRLDNVRRAMLVGQLSTTMRNVTGQVMRLGVDVLDESLLWGMQHALKAIGRDVHPTAHPLDAVRILHQATWSLLSLGRGQIARRSQLLTELVLGTETHPGIMDPRFRNRLFNVFASDIAAGTRDQGIVARGMERILPGLETAARMVNTLNRGQEFIFRRAIFAGKLDTEIRNLGGKGLADAIATHNELTGDMQARFGRDWLKSREARNTALADPRHFNNAVPEAAVSKAIQSALEMTFADNPAYGSGWYHWIKLVNKTPLTLVTPFARFMYVSAKFTYQYNPTGYLKLLSAEERTKLGKGDSVAIARATVGTAMLLAAYWMRDSEDAGEKWYQFYIPGTKKTVDIRPYNPFAAHFFIADIIHRWKGDATWPEVFAAAAHGKVPAKTRLYSMGWRDWLEGILSTNLRAGTGLAIVDSLFRGAVSIGSAADVSGTIGRFAGEYVSGYLTPLQTIADFFAGADADSRVVRDRRLNPFVGPIAARVPLAAHIPALAQPELELATRAGPAINPHPVLKQFTGLLVSDPQNALERELSRLQFTPQEIFTSTTSPAADALVKHYMGPLLEENLVPVVTSDGYRGLSDAEKGYYLHELLGPVRKVAKGLAMAERPDLFEDLHRRSLRQRLLEREISSTTLPPPGPPAGEEE